MSQQWGFNTRILHAGEQPDPGTGAISTPIFQSSTFVFKNAEQGAARFEGREEGYIYTRLSNPTTRAFELKMADLEGGEDAVAFSSGMAAISSILMALVSQGDHVITNEVLYGSTYDFFHATINRYGVTVSHIDTTNLDLVRSSITPRTRAIYIETPANPTMTLTDLRAVAAIGKEAGIPVVVDNTFASPVLQRPLALGCDVVVHSATKYIGGHGDVIAGVAIGSKELMGRVRAELLRNLGGVLGPFEAWLLLRGIKTMALRVWRHTENAQKVAEFLATHPMVEKVHYPGLLDFPQHQLAHRQMDGMGGMLSFEVKGGVEKGRRVMNAVRLCSLAVSLGDTATLIEHPASMTHAVVDPAERQRMGITDGLIRLSVGLEDADDIIADLDQALQA